MKSNKSSFSRININILSMKGCILRNGGAAWGLHDSLYTAMNIYQSFLQTNTKTGKLCKKGF
jgi:hypothetical protein